MKRLIIATISSLLVGSLASPVLASEISYQRLVQNTTYQTQPLNLVSLANQGYFKVQGIPAGNALVSAIRSGKVTAESLIQAGIAEGRISPDTIDDLNYIRNVNYGLEDLVYPD